MYNDLLVHVQADSIAAPSLTVLITGAEDRIANAGHSLSLDSYPAYATFNALGGCDADRGASVGRGARSRHKGGNNFAFTDGHVKWFKGSEDPQDDPIFFPPRQSACKSAVDPITKRLIGPKPGGEMTFNGRSYAGTFYIR